MTGASPIRPPGVVAAMLCAAIAVACNGRGVRNDDLGYDPAVTGSALRVDPLFDAPGLPIGRAGVPLRGAAVEGEWRTFRGNSLRTGTRLAPGIVSPVILWSTDVGIQGYANTPLVGDDAIYVSSQGDTHDMPDPADGFYALDPADGSQLWFHPTNEDINGASLTDELVIGGSDNGTLYGIDRESGRERWKIELDDPVRHGPLVDGNVARLQTRTGVVEIDVRSGTVRQILRGAEDSWDVRGAIAVDGDRVFRTADHCGLDAWRDGDPAWSATVCTPITDEWAVASNYTPPVLVGEAMLVAAPELLDYSSASLELSLRDVRDGSTHWSTALEQGFGDLTPIDSTIGYDMNYHTSVPWLMNGVVYVPQVTSRYVVGFDLVDGHAVTAIDLGDCRSRQFGSIVGVPSRGYYPRHDGRLYGFSPYDGSLTWTLNLQYSASAGAAVGTLGGYRYGYQDTYCTPDPWDGSALFATPAIGEDGVLYVGSGEGYLYAIGDSTW